MYKNYPTILITIIISGCSTNETQKFHKAADTIEARENFQNRKEACRNVGKTIYVKADATRIKRERRDEYDYKLASCH